MWRHLAKVSDPDFAFDNIGLLREFQHKMLSRTKLLNKTDSSSISKDGKIEAVHGLLEQQQTLDT